MASNTPNTPIAVTEKTVGQYVNDTLPALAKSYAVRDYNVNAWMKTAALAIVESKDLMDCLATEAGRISLRHALRFAATTGLSLNPQEGKACLVPMGGKIQYWPMKNGLIELALETGVVKYVRMNAVHTQDHFTLKETMDGDTYEFSPAKMKRGEIVGFFCAIRLKSGEALVEYMPRDEVEEFMKVYAKGGKNIGIEGYGIKTVAKRAMKRLALPSSSAAALDAELAIGEAEPAEFTETTAREKGASAGDVEKRLAAQPDPKDAPQAEPAPASAQGSTPSAPAPSPAGAPEAPSGQPEIF